jgi:predicted CoA-binding protein
VQVYSYIIEGTIGNLKGEHCMSERASCPLPFNLRKDAHSDSDVKKILGLRNIAVVGMLRDLAKPAHLVPKYLKEHAFNIIPVNPSAQEILGQRCYASLLDVNEPIDIVNVFRPSQEVPPIIEAAIKKHAKIVWLQEGIHNPKAEEEAISHGIEVVWNRCMMKEHARLYGDRP